MAVSVKDFLLGFLLRARNLKSIHSSHGWDLAATTAMVVVADGEYTEQVHFGVTEAKEFENCPAAGYIGKLKLGCHYFYPL
jgi:hypothetical protein